MQTKFLLAASAMMIATGLAHAGNQSSNTSSNTSSNNGVVRERVVETYCEDGYCETYVRRRVYQEDRPARGYRDYDRRRYRDLYEDDDDD